MRCDWTEVIHKPKPFFKGLSLDGLGRNDLDALNLLAQHVEQELATAKRRAREPWQASVHWPRPGTFGY